ncbi:hypothetical protein H6G00_00325 [Leptolyngbya sp. FACHB-541]|uniref:hypothetical protein n=1 Tax=Leptolyngbya sp. FACHB-541 TaxID=2692810 RepID=UPI001682802F|nr:hypothetical protein [Leptolyngbya sp. FACHB-541]MBD1995074.1 hypothetical protein [Leptolyngbya sp. FACHB-541]
MSRYGTGAASNTTNGNGKTNNGSSTRRDEFDRPKNDGLWGGFKKCLDIALEWITLVPHFLMWITGDGSPIVFGLLAAYFYVLGWEGWWHSLDASHPSFLPKPFVSDGARLINVFVAVSDLTFWLSVLISTAVNAAQTKIFRGVTVRMAKARYDEVRSFEVPDENPKAITLAEIRRKRFKNVGLLELRKVGGLIFFLYAMDFVQSHFNFPWMLNLWRFQLGLVVLHFVWWGLSVVGAELFGSMFQSSWEERKAH